MPRFELRITPSAGRQHVAFLKRFVPRAISMLKSPLREFSIALVGNARMSALHKQFLNIKGPTDVLTFPLDYDSRGRVISGEVILCVPYAAREARRRGIPVEHELLLYAVHGLLHLSGFDDTTESAFRRMHAMEDTILTRLGLGAVFSAEPTPAKRSRAKRARLARPAAKRREPGA